MVLKSPIILHQFPKKPKITTSTVLKSILNQNKKSQHSLITQDQIIDFKLKILKCHKIKVNELNKYKKYNDTFETVFCKRFLKSGIESILNDLDTLNICSVNLNLSTEVLDKLDSFFTIDNLTNDQLIKMVKSDTLSISKYPIQIQKLILLKILLPLGELNKADDVLANISKKISKFDLLQLLNAIKLFKGEILFNELTNLEIMDIFNSVESKSFKYELYLKYITHTKDLKLINQLFLFYSNVDIISDINKKINLDSSFEKLNFHFPIDDQMIPDELIKFYVDTLIQSKICSFEDLSTIELPAIISQKYIKSIRYSIDVTKYNKTPLKNVLQYYYNDFHKVVQYIKLLKGFRYNYIDPIDLQEFISKLTNERKCLLAFELSNSNVITNYAKLIIGTEQSEIINQKLSNLDAIDWFLTIYDNKSINYILKTCNNKSFVNAVNENWGDSLNSSIKYEGNGTSIDEIFLDLKCQNDSNSTEILKYLMDKHDPFKVMSFIGSNKTNSKYVSDLLGSEFKKIEIDYIVDQIDLVELTFHFWKKTNCFNIDYFTTKYSGYLSESKKVSQFIQFGILTCNSKIISNYYKFKVDDHPAITLKNIGMVKTESLLKYQRTIRKLTKFKPTKIKPDELDELFKELPLEYQPVLFKYLPELVKRIPYSEIVIKHLCESCSTNSKYSKFICKVMGVDIDNDIKYANQIMLKFDFNYLILILFHLLNKRNVKLDNILQNLKTSILLPKSEVNDISFEILQCISNSVNFNLKNIIFTEDGGVENVKKMLKLTSDVGVLLNEFEPIPNLTIATLVKFTHLISLSQDFKNVQIKDILSFWYVMLNSNDGEIKDQFMSQFGMWDLIPSEERKKLLLEIKRPKFHYDAESFNINDFNLFLRVLFYTGKFRDLTIEEVNYFVLLINNVIKTDKLTHKEKSFAIHIGYTLISKNSSILFKFHKDVIMELPNYKVFKENINMILIATCNTKISDLDLILNQLVYTHKHNRYEIDNEVINVLNGLISNNELDIAEELYLKYCSVCKYPKFKYEISNTMAWGKSLHKPKVGYKKGVVDTKVNGVNVKLFDKMLDD